MKVIQTTFLVSESRKFKMAVAKPEVQPDDSVFVIVPLRYPYIGLPI